MNPIRKIVSCLIYAMHQIDRWAVQRDETHPDSHD